jgi:hypothetical protein
VGKTKHLQLSEEMHKKAPVLLEEHSRKTKDISLEKPHLFT